MVHHQGAILLIWAKAQQDGISPRGNTPHLGESAAVVSLGAVHMEEGVQVRGQVECGRLEIIDGEEHGETQNEEATNRQSVAHHEWQEDGMSARCTDT